MLTDHRALFRAVANIAICGVGFVRQVCASAYRCRTTRQRIIPCGDLIATEASSATTCHMRYENQTLEGLTVNLDDDEVVGCHLVNCRILFGGKQLPIFSDNCSENCDFHFSESALVTIQLLRRMLNIPHLAELVLAQLGLLPQETPTLH
jgi:hypothetical protein